MSVTDNDLETLEELLDGELPVEQADLLRRRLSVEPELAQAMDRLRGDRQMRAHVFSALEPSDLEVETLVSNVRRDVRKEEVWASRYRTLRSVSGIAAAIVMIFAAGWISSRRLQPGPANPNSELASVDQTSTNPVPPVVSGSRLGGNNSFGIGPRLVSTETPLPLPTDPNNELFNGTGGGNAISNVRPAYQVVVIDPWGRIIDRRQFETHGDAQKFTEQLNRFQGRQPQNGVGVRRPSDNVMPVADQP